MKKQSGDKYGLLAGAAILVILAVLFLPRTGDDLQPKAASRPEATPSAVDPAVPLIGRPADDSLVYSVLTPSPPIPPALLVQRIDALPDTLTEAEAHAICEALREGLPDYKTFPADQKHHLGNQLMNAVLRQKNAGVRLAEELARIWQSPKADETLRDYALQHLGQLLEGRGPASPHPAAWRETGLPVLLDAARNTRVRSAGTALLALHFLSDPASPTRISVPELDGLTDTAAKDEKAHPVARMAAFQTASARGLHELLGTARPLARDLSVHSGLRLSAIQYLGTCGETTDRELLAAIERENDIRYRTASHSAHARLLSRFP